MSEQIGKKEKISLHVTEDINDVSPESVGEMAAVSTVVPADMPDFRGRFEVLELIGEGGMGVVYKVNDPALNKVFAVKVLRSVLATDMQALKRFQREAEAAIKLNHPGLVAVYEHSSLADGTPYLVMDFIEGQNLLQFIESNGKFETERAIRLFDQIAEALEHVHDAGLVHRDVKPRNIILSKTESGEDHIKLVDFGIAKDASQTGATTVGVTQTGDFLGSPLYMSPEQCQGTELESRSDLYSAGCVFYEMLTGKSPFASPNPVKIVVGHLSEKPKAPSAVLGQKNDLIAEVDALVLKCLEKSPARRYQTAAELRGDLAACLDDKKPFKLRETQQSSFLYGFVLVGLAYVAYLAINMFFPSLIPWEFWSVADASMRQASVATFTFCMPAFIALVVAMSKRRSRGKSLKTAFHITIPLAVSYILMVYSYQMLPHSPADLVFVIPYSLAALTTFGGALFCGLRYLASPKESLSAPLFIPSGRVPTQEENRQLTLFRSAIFLAFGFGALLFKAPEFLPLTQFGPSVLGLGAMSVFAFVSLRINKRLASPEKTKPGDRWLMFAGLAAALSSFGFAFDGIVNFLSGSFLITSSFATSLGVLAMVLAYAPVLVAIVFTAVWNSRRHNPSPFGKSDGW